MTSILKISLPIHFLLLLIIPFQIIAQPSLNGNAKRLRTNVVSIDVTPSNDPTSRNGFGFITGENGSVLYIVTAAHNIFGAEFETSPNQPLQIEVGLYESEKVKAICVQHWKKDDLALLEINKPARFHWQKKAIGLQAKTKQAITFIGRNREWQIPAEGFITRLDRDVIYADNSYIEPGTSGAPLLNRMGIIGMIVRDDIQRCEAISLAQIRRLLRTEGPSYYNLEGASELFNASNGDVYIFGGVESKRVGVPAYGVYPYTRVFTTSPSLYGGLELMALKNLGLGFIIEKNTITKVIEDQFFQNYFNAHTLQSSYLKCFISLNQLIIPGRLDVWTRCIYSFSEQNYELEVFEQDFDLIKIDVNQAKKFKVENQSLRAAAGLRIIVSKNLSGFFSFEYAFENMPLKRSSLETDVYYGHQAQIGIAFKL